MRGVRVSLHTRWEEARCAARFVVDATGTARLARRRGARLVAVDRLVGFTRFFASDLNHWKSSTTEARLPAAARPDTAPHAQPGQALWPTKMNR